MKETKRALRRHHRRRMIARILRSYRFLFADEAWRQRCSVRQYNNRQVCSCWMCGNPRRHQNRVTAQERRQHDAAAEELRDLP